MRSEAKRDLEVQKSADVVLLIWNVITERCEQVH